MAKITGRIEVLVNGVALLNKSGATASGIGRSGKPNFQRKEVMGDNGFHGFVEEAVLAKVEVTITDVENVSLGDLAELDGLGTVIFRAANGGKSYTLNNAISDSNFNITGGEGDTTAVFFGNYWTEATQ